MVELSRDPYLVAPGCGDCPPPTSGAEAPAAKGGAADKTMQQVMDAHMEVAIAEARGETFIGGTK